MCLGGQVWRGTQKVGRVGSLRGLVKRFGQVTGRATHTFLTDPLDDNGRLDETSFRTVLTTFPSLRIVLITPSVLLLQKVALSDPWAHTTLADPC